MDIIRQSNNQAQGDIIAGNKSETTFNFINQQTISELTRLYEAMKENGVGESSGDVFCDQLEHYLSKSTDGDVRGLEAKLQESGRADQIPAATRMKQQAAKAVMRYQTSRTAQRIYTIVLDELYTNFSLTVSPAIQSNADRIEVDQRIHAVLQNTRGVLGENLLELSVRDLWALLYFLGGNCHIRWDKC
ncbi:MULTISPECIES: ABC-three component system protein [Burkholderia cepacia complex]|uniref:ABC-three component system protein n=1 Tax=Burkholderia cepacia complex TaxID=87882 RepID=UPI002AB7EA7B|nr:ABC-three component system protein [Burkholderia cenocepacia]